MAATLFYDDVIFPESISLYAFKGKVTRRTRRIMLENGEEPRIALWATSLRSYDAGMVARPQKQWLTIESFYEVCFGPAIGFLLRDLKDYTVDATEGAFAKVSATKWAFQKRYRIGPRAVYRGIAKPKLDTLTIYRLNVDESVDVLDSAEYQIDEKNGFLLVASGTFPTGTEPLWSGEFYVPVQFDADDLDWETVNRSPEKTKGLLIMGPSVPLKEMRWKGMPYRMPDVYSGEGSGVGGSTSPGGGGGTTPATTIVILQQTNGGTVGHASRTFKFGVDGILAAPLTVVLHAFGDSGPEGTWTPPSFTMANSLDTQTATYTAASVGNKTLTRTNDGGLTNGFNISYNAVAYPPVLLATPSSLASAPNVPSGDITVGANAPLDVAVLVTPHSTGSGGSFTPPSATIGFGYADSVTFKRTATTAGSESITFTNDHGLGNPAAITLTVQPPPSAIALSPSTMSATTGTHSDEFTVTLDHPAAVNTTVTPHSTGTGGSFTSGAGSYEVPVTSLLFSPGDTTKKFRRVAASAATETITVTNDQGLTNPTGATLTVTTPSAPPPAPSFSAFDPTAQDGGTLSNGNRTIVSGSGSSDHGSALGLGKIDASDTIGAGYAVEFTVDTTPGSNMMAVVMRNGSATSGNLDPDYSINGQPYFRSNTSSNSNWQLSNSLSGTAAAWVAGDKIGLVVYGYDTDGFNSSAALFRNGTLIASGPVYFGLRPSRYAVITKGPSLGMTVHADPADQTYASVYRAFRDGTVTSPPMIDAVGWPAAGSPPRTALTDGTYTNFGGTNGDELHYHIDVPAGQTSMVINAGGSSFGVEFSVYVGFGYVPTVATHDSTFDVAGKTTSTETIAAPAGRYNFLIVCHSTFSTASIQADYS